MGKSLPPPAAIDLVGSYARRRGSDAEVVMWDPKLGGTSGVLQFKKGRGVVEGTVELIDDESGRRLVARAPRGKLSDGTWSMLLRSESGDDEPVDARLLVQGDRPLVLLWGAEGQNSYIPSKRTVVTSKKKAAASAGRVLDRALSVLPPERAASVRQSARRTARKLLK